MCKVEHLWWTEILSTWWCNIRDAIVTALVNNDKDDDDDDDDFVVVVVAVGGSSAAYDYGASLWPYVYFVKYPMKQWQ